MSILNVCLLLVEVAAVNSVPQPDNNCPEFCSKTYGVCPTLKCRGISCQFGFVEKNGCQTCECLPDPCLRVRCSPGHTCQGKKVICAVPPCPAGAVCEPTGAVVPNPLMTCPQVSNETSSGICLEECSENEDCSADELCCSNGCGHICTTVGIVEH
ncbi:hypothetical protein CAPTEDRAFT_188625 [Capitella teleta]|uniref:WAP domain-containing protein n=1 Tax=Capitella teleta TaxID=283909 RepID=R7VHX9_CAPTE|nr:hypothetical protein CAPTEDRAFT_188625 [Capitella teleta]|eukprot:ELU18194.1 hypothetical protein CAPTEDRAFT_188625 [Capitella teleta]